MKKDDLTRLTHDVLLQGTELAHQLSRSHDQATCCFSPCVKCEALKTWDKILSTREHREFRVYINNLQGKKK